MGAEITSEVKRGFSRIPQEVWVRNEKAGLYAYNVKNHYVILQEMGNHFDKERKMRNAQVRSKRRKKSQKVRKEQRENVFANRNRHNDWTGQSRYQQNPVQRQQAFIPKGLRPNKRSTSVGYRNTSKNGRRFATKSY